MKKTYEYFVDEASGMACIIDTTHSFMDEADALEDAEKEGYKLVKVDAPDYAYDKNGALREDMLTW